MVPNTQICLYVFCIVVFCEALVYKLLQSIIHVFGLFVQYFLLFRAILKSQLEYSGLYIGFYFFRIFVFFSKISNFFQGFFWVVGSGKRLMGRKCMKVVGRMGNDVVEVIWVLHTNDFFPWGKYTSPEGDVYEGDFVDGAQHGKGVFTSFSG